MRVMIQDCNPFSSPLGISDFKDDGAHFVMEQRRGSDEAASDSSHADADRSSADCFSSRGGCFAFLEPTPIASPGTCWSRRLDSASLSSTSRATPWMRAYPGTDGFPVDVFGSSATQYPHCGSRPFAPCPANRTSPAGRIRLTPAQRAHIPAERKAEDVRLLLDASKVTLEAWDAAI